MLTITPDEAAALVKAIDFGFSQGGIKSAADAKAFIELREKLERILPAVPLVKLPESAPKKGGR